MSHTGSQGSQSLPSQAHFGLSFPTPVTDIEQVLNEKKAFILP
jgi:hypothetical protein